MIGYLTENRIWLQSRSRIRLLHGKTILIVEGESSYQSLLCVTYYQPDDPDSDNCTLSVEHVVENEAIWPTPLPDTIPMSSQAHYRKRYLSQAAVDLIVDNIEESHGELLLVIPQE